MKAASEGMKEIIKAAIDSMAAEGGGGGTAAADAGTTIEMSEIAEEDLRAIGNIIKQAMASGGGGMESAIASIAQQYPAGLQALATSTDSYPKSAALPFGLLDVSSDYTGDDPDS